MPRAGRATATGDVDDLGVEWSGANQRGADA
jgi:hypothetical protein